MNIKISYIFILICCSLGIVHANDSSNVVAEYYIDSTSNKDYKLLRLSNLLKPMPRISLSEYEQQFFRREKYQWNMKISNSESNLSFICNHHSYDTEKIIYETEELKLDLDFESEKRDSVVGLKLQPVEVIRLSKETNIEQYINKIIPMQWSIKTDIYDFLYTVKGSFSIKILDKGKDEKLKHDFYTASACLPSVEEVCGNTRLLNLSDKFLKLLPKIMNLGDIIFENIPESCDTVFISEKLYKVLDKNKMKNLNDSLNKVRVKFLFADEIYTCTRHDRENKLSETIFTENCKIEVTNAGTWMSSFAINEHKYCIINHERNDYILSYGKYYDFHSGEPICSIDY